jgi:hypothetical protein
MMICKQNFYAQRCVGANNPPDGAAAIPNRSSLSADKRRKEQQTQMSQPKVRARILTPVLAAAVSATLSGAAAEPNPSIVRISSNPGVPMINYERAAPSPSPAGAMPADGGAKEGLMIVDLMARGVRRLDGAEVQRLIVGKTMIVRNTVTGDKYEVSYGADGQCVVRRTAGKRQQPEAVRDVLNFDAPGWTSSYDVTSDGKLRTFLDGRSFTVMIYKNGGAYLAIGSDEFELPAKK